MNPLRVIRLFRRNRIFLLAGLLCLSVAAASIMSSSVHAASLMPSSAAARLMSSSAHATSKPGISFDRASVNVLKGQSRSVRIRCSGKYTVKSSDPSVATVTHNGTVKGKNLGDCEMIVKKGSLSARLPIHVLRSVFDSQMLLIGHRGYQDRYPENTIRAFSGALNYGADGVELDVWSTKSNDLLVFHDPTLSRMCGKSGSIRKLTASSRRKYRVRAYGIKDMIPTLEEALSFLCRKDAIAFVHIKRNGGSVVKGKSADLIAETIRKTGMADRSIVFCGSDGTLRYFMKHHSDIETGYNYRGGSTSKTRGRMRHAVGCGASWFIFITTQGLTFSNVKYAHSLGLNVGLYKTTTKEMLYTLIDYEADAAIMYHKLV